MSETTNEYTEDEDSYMLEEDEEGDKGQTWSDVEKDSEDIRVSDHKLHGTLQELIFTL